MNGSGKIKVNAIEKPKIDEKWEKL